jgi:glycosyltransferase involved in cell wall biosynthesis
LTLFDPDAHPLVSIILPTYNEERAIVQDLTTIRTAMDSSGYSYELLVIDDGSRDQTVALAASLPGVQVIKHGYNRGEGAARSTGMRAARGQIYITTDADGSYPNHELPRLVEGILAGADMVIGARSVEAGTMRRRRTFAKEFIRRLACYLTATHIPDLNSGFRAVRVEVGRRFLPVLPSTHSWVSTITIAALSNNYRVDFLPIDYYPRIGTSSFHPITDTYNYLVLVLRTITLFNPLKIFLPFSLGLVSLGVLKAVYDLMFNLRFRESDVVLIVVGMLIGMMGLLADLQVTSNRYRYLPESLSNVEWVPPRANSEKTRADPPDRIGTSVNPVTAPALSTGEGVAQPTGVVPQVVELADAPVTSQQESC